MKEKDKIYSMHYGAKAFTFDKAQELRVRCTEAENILWEELRNNKLDGIKFRRQHPIGRFIADFYCHKFKLVIEVDGSVHDDPLVKENDQIRQEEIELFGLKVIRFKNNDVKKRTLDVINNIRNTVKAIGVQISYEEKNERL